MYIEHEKECRIFSATTDIWGSGLCNCPARFGRAPLTMGPHEQHCPYLTQTKGEHGICYCGADPKHDSTCRDWTCPFWSRRWAPYPVYKVG